MPLSTGTATPGGTIITGDGIYIEGGPEVYFQAYAAPLRFSPDAEGHYWGLSGSAGSPVYQIECYDDLQLTDDVTSNPITCQNLGEVDTLTRRNHIGLTFTMKSLLPFSILSKVLRGQTHVVGDEHEGFGMGEIATEFFHVFFSRIYDQTAGDFISMTIHKARFVNASPLSTPYGDAWNIAVEMQGFADTTKPRGQRFGTWKRQDISAL